MALTFKLGRRQKINLKKNYDIGGRRYEKRPLLYMARPLQGAFRAQRPGAGEEACLEDGGRACQAAALAGVGAPPRLEHASVKIRVATGEPRRDGQEVTSERQQQEGQMPPGPVNHSEDSGFSCRGHGSHWRVFS